LRGSFGGPQPFLTLHTGNVLLSQWLFFPAMIVETSSCIRNVFKMTAVWAASSLHQHMSIDDRDSSFASPVGKEMAAISAKQQLAIHQYHQQSTDTPPTVDRNTSVEVSAECRPTYQLIVSTNGLLTWITCRPTISPLSVEMSTMYWPISRPTVCQYIGQQYRLILKRQMP